MLPPQRKIRVLVVDDSAVARAFLTKGLSAYPNIEVVGYAINALDAKAKILRLQARCHDPGRGDARHQRH